VATFSRRLEDLEAVLITHAHSDHTGFAERARTTAGAPVWIHQVDAAVAKGAKPGKNDGTARSYLLRVEFYRTLFSLAPRGDQADPDPGGVDLRRWRDAGGAGSAVGGACPWSHAGVCGAAAGGAGMLLTGDVLATRNRLLVGSARRSCRRVSTAIPHRRCDPSTCWTGVPAELLLPGHGEPWTEGAAEAARLARVAGPS
jgi:Metallo-beta-lactamase superfamily